MNEFKVRITVDGRYRYFKVKELHNDGRREQYEIVGRDRSIVVQSNRPFFRNKGLRHRVPDWRVIEGTVRLRGNLDKIIEEIMKVIDI